MSLETVGSAAPSRAAKNGADRILDHIIKAVEAVEAEMEPFCHIYVENIFPDDVYAEILERLPGAEHYDPLNLKAWSRADGESTRDRMFLSEDGLKALPETDRSFWWMLAQALTSDRLKRTVYAKLARDIALRCRVGEGEVADLPGHPRAVLFRDTDEYRIKPHPDGMTRIVTMQYYLPRDLSQEHLGTSLYVKNPLHKRLTHGTFEEVKRMPYRPNSGYAFVVNNLPERTSWHGREYIEPGNGVRHSILTQFREDPDGHDY